jgi:DNA-binding beta-propeller fold protein YncE
VVTAGAIAGVLFLPGETTANEEGVLARGLSHLVYPATVVGRVPAPVDGPFRLPAAAVTVGNATFVIDTGDARLLKLDANGKVAATFDASSDPRLVFKQPMAMATDGSKLYIANSLASEILVVDSASGRFSRSIQLQPLKAGEKAPRPIGVALLPNGGLAVSDADNHRVLILDEGGRVVRTIGTGTRASGKDGFNVPAGIATDQAGNLYVVDTLNSRVAEFAPDGSFLTQFGRAGVTAGTLARPKGVAVDAAGRVFVSDAFSVAVEVFNPDGSYLGLIGRADPKDPTSASLFRAPASLSLSGDRLLVTDRIAGLITLQLGDPAHPEANATPGGQH